jgi:hypothetical protein
MESVTGNPPMENIAVAAELTPSPCPEQWAVHGDTNTNTTKKLFQSFATNLLPMKTFYGKIAS